MFKIRCSQLGKIAANSKGGELSVGAKSYVEEKAKEFIYGIKKEIQSKYMDKGNFCEDENIETYGNYKNTMYLKNEKHFSDDLFTGTPDILTKDVVIDIKSSWDAFTFPLFDDKINKDYYLQLQGYMHLTGRRKAILAYVLTDTPVFIDDTQDITYKNVPLKYRIKECHFDYDQKVIDDLSNKAEMCQKYFNELINK